MLQFFELPDTEVHDFTVFPSFELFPIPLTRRVTKIATVVALVSAFQQDNQTIVIWDSQLRKGLNQMAVGKSVEHFPDLVIDVGGCCLLLIVTPLDRLSKP